MPIVQCHIVQPLERIKLAICHKTDRRRRADIKKSEADTQETSSASYMEMLKNVDLKQIIPMRGKKD